MQKYALISYHNVTSDLKRKSIFSILHKYERMGHRRLMGCINKWDQRNKCNIQLGDSNGEDIRFRKWENMGMHTVKSAYKRL